MISHKPKAVMARTEHLEGYGLFRNGWKIKEIGIELHKSPATIQNWRKKFGWDWKLSEDLRDIEKEMRDKVQKAREQIIDIGTQTLNDVFVRDANGDIVGVNVVIEDVKDLRGIAETILKTAGIPDKVETKNETVVKGDLTVKTEQIDPDLAAEVGRLLALRESVEVEE